MRECVRQQTGALSLQLTHVLTYSRTHVLPYMFSYVPHTGSRRTRLIFKIKQQQQEQVMQGVMWMTRKTADWT